MNKLWVSIILISFIYGLCTGRIDVMVKSMYDVCNETVTMIFSIASVMFVWSSIFNILNKCNVLKYIAKPFLFFIKPLKLNETEEVTNNLAVAFAINALGLGLASVPFMIKSLKNCRKENVNKILLFNLCPITLFPTTVLSIRNDKTLTIWIMIIFISFLMYLITIIYLRIGKINE